MRRHVLAAVSVAAAILLSASMLSAGTAAAEGVALLQPRPAGTGIAKDEAEGRHGPILLELFTSQGCSACPPADRLLATLATREDVLALSFHVSYWDHMGWSDPFAIAASVRRQRGYARAMRSRSIYTPQMIIQGSAAAVGSDEARIARLIREAAPVIRLSITREEGAVERFTIRIPALPDVTVALELWAVLYANGDRRFVPLGENAGHLLQHVNVVRQAGIVAAIEATPALVQFDRPDIGAVDGLAMVLQARNLGPVVGTGVLALR